MNRAPTPRVMFQRLLLILKLKESKFVPGDHAKGRAPVMTKGLTLGMSHPGDRYGARISVELYDGTGTGCSSLLHACGAREFANKVWAIEDGLEIKRRLGKVRS